MLFLRCSRDGRWINEHIWLMVKLYSLRNGGGGCLYEASTGLTVGWIAHGFEIGWMSMGNYYQLGSCSCQLIDGW